jgi:hypothetical protein
MKLEGDMAHLELKKEKKSRFEKKAETCNWV